MKSHAIIIGNTDNKLTQQEWATFCLEMFQFLSHAGAVHFTGFSAGNSPWQNACWVVEAEKINETQLRGMCVRYRQDSILVMTAEPTFVRPRPTEGEKR